VVGDKLKPLPIGSRINAQEKVFTWGLGAGFTAEYQLLFISQDAEGDPKHKEIHITVH